MHPDIARLTPYEIGERLTHFERDLEKEDSITSEHMESLFGRLDLLAKALRQFAISYPFSQGEVSIHLDRVVSLYGRVVTRYQESTVNAIGTQASKLEKSLDEGKIRTLAQDVESLRQRITLFCEHNRPPKASKHIISRARHSLARAHAALHGQDFSLDVPTTVAFDQYNDQELNEFAHELLEIGFLFWQKKSKSAYRRFNQVSETFKHRFYAHLVEAGGNPLEIDAPLLPCLQALVHTAFEITDSLESNTMMSQQEIDSFFQERFSLESSEKTSHISRPDFLH